MSFPAKMVMPEVNPSMERPMSSAAMRSSEAASAVMPRSRESLSTSIPAWTVVFMMSLNTHPPARTEPRPKKAFCNVPRVLPKPPRTSAARFWALIMRFSLASSVAATWVHLLFFASHSRNLASSSRNMKA
jgi:hypothetical protein